MSEEEFKRKYLIHTEEGFTFNEKPCSFLTENGCSIYECRPADCREYPFTDKKQIQTRLINLVNNCETCPLVFEIFERLKAHYGEEFVEYKEEYRRLWGANNNSFASIPFSSVTESKVEVGRNAPCTCGSGKKYKKCCGRNN